MRLHSPARFLAAGAVLLAAACTAPSAAPSDAPSASAAATPAVVPSPVSSPTAPLSPSPAQSPERSASPEPLAWTALATTGDGPSAREDHTWTADGDGSVAYLFGGRSGSKELADLWAFDLTTDAWRRLRPEGPAPKARFGHEAAWVPHVGLVVFAGQAGSTFFDDLWTYDPAANAWRKLPGSGSKPVARYGSCSAVGPDGRLWISHGFTSEGSRFADTRAYDFAAGRWTDVTPDGPVPVERCLHGCFWTDQARFVLYAGQTTGATALGDLWSFGRGEPWAKADATNLPPARNLYAFAAHAGDWLVFGGQGEDKRYRDDLWLLDGETLAFRKIAVPGAGPDGRSGSTLIDDRDRGRLLLFGGKDGDGELADSWELRGLP